MVKMRLARRGRRNLALFDVVIADARAPRDGRFIEKIGTYNPGTDPASVNLDEEKAFQWLMKGAQPTDTVRAMLSYRGILMRKHLQVGVNKGAITQEEADTRLEAWKKEKDAKIQAKVDRLAEEKSKQLKAKLEAEAKVKEKRAEELAQRQKEAEAAAQTEAEAVAQPTETAEEGQTTEAPAADAQVAPESPATEEPKVEAPKEEQPNEEQPKAEAPKEEPPKEEQPKEEAPKEESSDTEKKAE